jgi:glycine/D-amino acid oxidase-like deaminating enzyme
MKTSYDAIILGAGIVGAACARELAKRGMSVAIVERDSVAGGATGAAMGHIVVMDDSPAQFALTRYAQSLWQALAAELPPSVEYNQPGTIWVAADEEEMAELGRKRQFFAGNNIRASVLDARQLAEAEPNLARSLAGGLLVSSDAIVDPARAAKYLLEEACRRNTELRVGRAAISAAYGTVVLDDRSELAAPILVNATGSTSPRLSPGIPVRRRKGHLMITAANPGFVHHQLVELGYLKSAHASDAESVAFNVQPRQNGQILIGSSRLGKPGDRRAHPGSDPAAGNVLHAGDRVPGEGPRVDRLPRRDSGQAAADRAH